MGEEGYLTLNGLDWQLNWYKRHGIGGMPTLGRLRKDKVALLRKAVSLYEERSIDGPDVDSDGEEEASTWVVFPNGTFTNEWQSEGNGKGKGKGKA